MGFARDFEVGKVRYVQRHEWDGAREGYKGVSGPLPWFASLLLRTWWSWAVAGGVEFGEDNF